MNMKEKLLILWVAVAMILAFVLVHFSGHLAWLARNTVALVLAFIGCPAQFFG